MTPPPAQPNDPAPLDDDSAGDASPLRPKSASGSAGAGLLDGGDADLELDEAAKAKLRRARGGQRSQHHQQAHMADLLDDDAEASTFLTSNLARSAFQSAEESRELSPEDLQKLDEPVVPSRRKGKSSDKEAERHLLTPKRRARMVTTDAELAELIEKLREPSKAMGGRAAFAYDSEFIGEHTYLPKLCLIQVASPKLVAFIDPLTDVDLQPFWELVGDESVVKIVHAGDQDLIPVVRAGVTPKNVFDTQIVAGFCALPYPASLSKLVEYVCGERLSKGMTFSQWDERPLSKKQLKYAADDVRFLPQVMVALELRLANKTGLGDWAMEECQLRAEPSAIVRDGEPWDRVKGGGSLDERATAILRKLAVWRDDVARRNDLPVRTLVRDEVLVSIARRPPRDVERLAAVRHMPRPIAEQYGSKLLDVIEAGKQADPVEKPELHEEPTLKDKFRTDAAWSVVQALCHCQGLDPDLVVSRREVEVFLRQAISGENFSNHRLLTGWRRHAVGDKLINVLTGSTFTLCWPTGANRSKRVG